MNIQSTPGKDLRSLWACLAVVAATGCGLPLGPASPQSATTVGKGRWGGAVHTQLPTVDLLATRDDSIVSDDETATTGLAVSLELSRGLSEKLDLELSLDGGLYVVIPVPLGVSGGFRYSLVDSDTLAVAAAGRLGTLGYTSENDDGQTRARAVYARASVAAQLFPHRSVRPGVALTAIPAWVSENGPDGRRSDGATAVSATGSVTFVLGPVQLAPFIGVTRYASGALDQTHIVTSVGLSFAARPR